MSLLSFAVVYESIANMKLKSSIACKVLYCLYYWLVSLSVVLVAVVAVERYRGVRMQKRSHIASPRVTWVIATCTAVMMVFSFKAFLTVGVNSVRYQLMTYMPTSLTRA